MPFSMEKYLSLAADAWSGYASYLWREISFQTQPFWKNYFWMLVAVSLVFFGLEQLRPWRKEQPRFRQDFWLDFFYMFFNFFLFSLIGYQAASSIVVNLFNDGIRWAMGFDLQASNPLRLWPWWAVLLTGFVVRDFVQWWVHRLLHASPRLWEFHKVHHSVGQMGFAAHLRYHWMETVIYRSIEYIPLALLGVGLHDFFLIHLFTLIWGHYNHANFQLSGRVTGGIVFGLAALFIATTSYELGAAPNLLITLGGAAFGALVAGPYMKYIFNSPDMHIWHHAYDIPQERPLGINFGITLALWDYLFRTAWMPRDGRDIKLGFPGVEQFPQDFLAQNLHGLAGQGRGKEA
jgi:sterol desaturase/sphingolipid hydroxylase (fatty acid hydroxylase superfamily)